MLSRQAILSAIERKWLVITPFNEDDVEKVHINLHLKDGMVLPAKAYRVGRTQENIKLTDELSGLVEGRATLAKQGISVEQSSHLVEPGTNNHLTLEVFNAGDKEVKLEAGQEIAKLYLFKVQAQL